MENYKPYEYKGKTMLLDTYLILAEEHCSPEDYDIFDMELNNTARLKMAEVERNGYQGFKIFDELNREFFNSFKYYDNPKDKKIYLYTEVFSKTRTKIIINITCAKGKLWVNGRCLSIHHCDWSNNFHLTLYLKKGKNIFLVEKYSPESTHVLSVQLLNYKYEMSDEFNALSNCSTTMQVNPLMLIHEPFYQPTALKYRFMYMKNNDSEYKTEYRIDIYDSSTGFYKTLNAKANKVVKIDIAQLRNLHEDTVCHVWIGCIFKDHDNKDFVTGLYLFLNDFEKKRIEISDKLLRYAKELNTEIAAAIKGRTQRQQTFINNGDKCSLYWYTWQFKNLLLQIETGNFPYKYFKNPGVQEFYIHSNLDNSFIRIAARIPKDYDKNNTYPVFLALSTGNEGWFSCQLPEYKLPEPVLCFDVTGRGFTGGSYIGEASTFEILQWIRKNYSIDKNRIYILGSSNGGFATWATALDYPHLAAAIYPLTGYVYIKNIENTTNIPTYQLVSPKDHVFAGRENQVKNKLKQYGNYHQYDFKEMIHHHLGFYIAHPIILNEMLKSTRNLNPNKIIFRTERNRHLESFWIKLHCIRNGEHFARIKAIVEADNFISINIQNTDGFTLTIPPQINKDDFHVKINGKNFHFQNYDKQRLIFSNNKGWSVIDNEPPVDYRKGTGLLDVYLDSMRIIVPENCSEIVNKTAENFARPHSNGADHVVCVNYPVYRDNDVPDHIFEHNLILFDIDGNNNFVRRFKDKLTVYYDHIGYEYQGERLDGNYVVMQIISNPYDSKLSMLIISTNNEDLLQKHILLRKVIIPTYCNGIHTYWNNEILTFINGKYYSAYESGDKLKPIENVKMRIDGFGREF